MASEDSKIENEVVEDDGDKEEEGEEEDGEEKELEMTSHEISIQTSLQDFDLTDDETDHTIESDNQESDVIMTQEASPESTQESTKKSTKESTKESTQESKDSINIMHENLLSDDSQDLTFEQSSQEAATVISNPRRTSNR